MAKLTAEQMRANELEDLPRLKARLATLTEGHQRSWKRDLEEVIDRIENPTHYVPFDKGIKWDGEQWVSA